MKKHLAIAAVLSVAVTAVFYVLLIKPKMSQISDTRSDVAAAVDEQGTLENRVRRLQEAQRNAPEFIARLGELERLLPKDVNLPAFIRQIQSAAEGAGVSLESIAPSPPQALEGAKGVSVIAVALNFDAPFQRVRDFLHRVETLERVIEVQSVTLGPQVDPDTGQLVLGANAQIRMYAAEEKASVSGPASGEGS